MERALEPSPEEQGPEPFAKPQRLPLYRSFLTITTTTPNPFTLSAMPCFQHFLQFLK